MYEKELAAIGRSGRFRELIMADPKAIDMASNDYLGLAHRKKLFERACKRVGKYPWHAPKASLFLGGYHPIHRDFETALREANGFEAGIVVGSGFLANLGLIEALVRRNDVLFVDESYHASGMVAAKLVQGKVVPFRHNDPEDLSEKLSRTPVGKRGRRLVAVEGVYSMEGDVVKREILELADESDAVTIVDEAHSGGTMGPRLLGVFDHYGIVPGPRHVKMGTLGKAYGSYGAYILASEEIVAFLHNRAKPLIYTTAPSLFDIALAQEGFEHIAKKRELLKRRIARRKAVVEEMTGRYPESMIVPFPVEDIPTLMRYRRRLAESGFDVGAIRPPTVERPMLRIILRTPVKPKAYRRLFRALGDL
ncbi:aminotransferase class I/II-fold pyridoxal phosphate-dependent enzyme [Hydrogenimonas sp.]